MQLRSYHSIVFVGKSVLFLHVKQTWNLKKKKMINKC